MLIFSFVQQKVCSNFKILSYVYMKLQMDYILLQYTDQCPFLLSLMSMHNVIDVCYGSGMLPVLCTVLNFTGKRKCRKY
jgi:hypothetical protein